MRNVLERNGTLPVGLGATLVALLAVLGCSEPPREVVSPVVTPPPAGGGWDELADWAAEAYRELGFLVGPGSPRIEVVPEKDVSALLDGAAQEFAEEILEVAPRSHAETRWMLRRALGRSAAESPEAQLEEDVAQLMTSTPLWYDRRTQAIHILDHHPFFLDLPRYGDPLAECERWHLMAHEVAHALQDQREPLREASGDGSTYEKHIVRKCLFEGEAELRMLTLAARLAGYELEAMEPEWCMRELERLFARGAPSFYDAGFAYLLGELQSGGWESVERAVRDPRISTRDLLEGEGIIKSVVDVTLPDWPEPSKIEYEWDDVIGAWGMLGILGSDYQTPEERESLTEIALSWRGDRFAVARRADGVTATLWRIVFKDERSARSVMPFFIGSEATVTQNGKVLDLAWSPVPTIQRELLRRLELHSPPE